MAAKWGEMPTGMAWAEQVEQEEAQNGGALVNQDEFPSLGEAVKKQPAKKKPQKLSLNAFLGNSAGFKEKSDKDLRLSLPTAPRERTDDGESGGLGGAFKEYDGGRRGGFGRRDDREGGFGDRKEREDGPSRADQADDWGTEKKYVPGSGGFGGGGGFGSRDRDRGERSDGRFRDAESHPSAADESADWGREKKFESRPAYSDSRDGRGAPDRRERYGGFREGGDRKGFAEDRPARADDEEWGRGRGFQRSDSGDRAGNDSRERKGYGFGDSRPSDVDKWSRRGPDPPSSGPTPEERPKLNLKPRSTPVEPLRSPTPEMDIKPESRQSENGGAAAVTQAKKSNPFGAARPREEVLKEKGIDWKKETLKLEHEEGLRAETEEEQHLKEEISALKSKLDALREVEPEESDEAKELAEELDSKEVQLYKLAAELDDKVRFAKDKERRERSDRPDRLERQERERPDRDRGERFDRDMHNRDRPERDRTDRRARHDPRDDGPGPQGGSRW